MKQRTMPSSLQERAQDAACRSSDLVQPGKQTEAVFAEEATETHSITPRALERKVLG